MVWCMAFRAGDKFFMASEKSMSDYEVGLKMLAAKMGLPNPRNATGDDVVDGINALLTQSESLKEQNEKLMLWQERYERERTEILSELKKYKQKFGYSTIYGLDRPLTRFQAWVMRLIGV